MATAYLLLLHDHPARALRLVERLWNTDDSFVIHVDRRAPAEVYTALFFGLGGRGNIWFTQRRRRVRRFSFSMVEATLQCLFTLVQTGRSFDHAVLLSGTHYPLKPAPAIGAFFRDHVGHSFLWWEPLPPWKRPRIEAWFVRGDLLELTLRPPARSRWSRPRRPPRGFEVLTGSQWWALSRPAVDAVLDTVRARRDVVRYFRYTLCPDEMFFQTLLLNGPLRDTVVRDNLIYETWSGRDRPEVLTPATLPALKLSRALFARKVEADRNRLADLIDAELLERHRRPV